VKVLGLTAVLLEIQFFWYAKLVVGYVVPEVSKIEFSSYSGSNSPNVVSWMDCA
jgi:hypothetical protein